MVKSQEKYRRINLPVSFIVVPYWPKNEIVSTNVCLVKSYFMPRYICDKNIYQGTIKLSVPPKYMDLHSGAPNILV